MFGEVKILRKFSSKKDLNFTGKNPVIGSSVDKIDKKNRRQNVFKMFKQLDLENRLRKIKKFNKKTDLDLTDLPAPPRYDDSDNDNVFLISLPSTPSPAVLLYQPQTSILISNISNTLFFSKWKSRKCS